MSELAGPGEWYPVPGFYFKVLVVGIVPSTDDCSFQEVTGIESELQTETIEDATGNVWVVPRSVKYSNLVLKRGVMPTLSYLTTWVQMVMTSDFLQPISPKNIVVTLNNENGIPVYAWGFANAYPIKWSVSALDSMKNEYLTETIEFRYQYFKWVPIAAVGNTLSSLASIFD